MFSVLIVPLTVDLISVETAFPRIFSISRCFCAILVRWIERLSVAVSSSMASFASAMRICRSYPSTVRVSSVCFFSASSSVGRSVL